MNLQGSRWLVALRVFAIGMVMGAAEVVPGVSGGTIAFISGIYERLVNALREFTPGLLVILRRHGARSAWSRCDGSFLALLAAGMAITVLLFANGISWLLEHEPIALWSFFCGLVLASVYVVTREMSRFGFDLLMAGAAGTAFGLVVTTLVPIEVTPNAFYFFVAGAVAVCAWILPGLSGSFILLILGLYAFVIEAIRNLDLIVLLSLGAGCAIGLVSFSQVLSRLMRYYRDETLAVLTGFMVGSLVKLWPWKHTLSYQLTEDGSKIPLVQEPVLPETYFNLTGNAPEIGIACVAAVAGLVVVVLVHWLGSNTDGVDLR